MDQQAITRLRSVELGVGTDGVAMTVGIIDPIIFGGETVTRASLPDAAFLRDRDVRIGDAVSLCRLGTQLTVAEVLPTLRTGGEQAVRLPSTCPVCGCDLRQRSRDLVCSNAACPAQLAARIARMAGPEGFAIPALDSGTIERLVAGALVATPSDIFKLKERNLVRASFSTAEARELLDAIEGAKSITLARLLVAMTGISTAAAESVASHARTLARVKRLVAGSVARLPDLSIDAAEALVNFMREPRNRRTLAQMARAGVTTARVPPS